MKIKRGEKAIGEEITNLSQFERKAIEAQRNKKADYERNYWRQFLDCLFHTQTLQTISLALLAPPARSDAKTIIMKTFLMLLIVF